MMSTEKRRRMAEFAWYHTVDLGDGITTPGQYDHRALVGHYGLPADLSGKTVLDVGPAHGFFAFEMERRGAARVVTAELPAWSAHDGSPELKAGFDRDGTDERNESYLHGAFAFAIAARGSQVEQTFCNVYDLDPSVLGTFDLVFCGSLLIHLSDPLRALYAIRRVTRGQAIIATTIDPDRLGRRAPRARFVGRNDGQTFWAPNLACLEAWARAAGFAATQRVAQFRLRSVDGLFDEPHGVIRADVDEPRSQPASAPPG
jgi:tRNA (mo5U34)-methyltransferase